MTQARLTQSELEAMVARIRSSECGEEERAELSRQITLNNPLFLKLKLPADEAVIWCAYNPTFHRSTDYGIAVSMEAIYLFAPLLVFFGSWRRYPIKDIQSANFRDSRWAPKLLLKMGDRTISFRTPYDGYQDEMDFDRKHLANAAGLVNQLVESLNSRVVA